MHVLGDGNTAGGYGITHVAWCKRRFNDWMRYPKDKSMAW